MCKSKLSILFYLVFMSFLSCNKEEIETIGLTEQDNSSKKTAEILLSNGIKVSFIQVKDSEVDGVFILEEGDCLNCSALTALKQHSSKDLSSNEIFWALSNPGTAIPSFLEKPSSDQQKMTIQQGWGRSLQLKSSNDTVDEKASSSVIACKNRDFLQGVATADFVRLDKTPENYRSFINDCNKPGTASCSKGTRYRYAATFNNVTKWTGRMCSKSVQNSSNDHFVTLSCNGIPCRTYKGPEIYYEYFSEGRWKSLTNNIPYRVGPNSKVFKTHVWDESKKVKCRIRVKNAMKKDQFDILMDKGLPNEGDNRPQPFIPPAVPRHVKLNYGRFGNQNNRIVIDFNKMTNGKPEITIPVQYLRTLPFYEDEVVFPNNYCGLRIFKADRFLWLDPNGNMLNNSTYNSMPEGSSSIGNIFGHVFDQHGIEFTGPIGACSSGTNNQWNFPTPFTKTGHKANDRAKLVIELQPGESKIEFVNHHIQPGKVLNSKNIYKVEDFEKILKHYIEELNSDFDPWLERLCQESPNHCPFD